MSSELKPQIVQINYSQVEIAEQQTTSTGGWNSAHKQWVEQQISGKEVSWVQRKQTKQALLEMRLQLLLVSEAQDAQWTLLCLAKTYNFHKQDSSH